MAVVTWVPSYVRKFKFSMLLTQTATVDSTLEFPLGHALGEAEVKTYNRSDLAFGKWLLKFMHPDYMHCYHIDKHLCTMDTCLVSIYLRRMHLQGK